MLADLWALLIAPIGGVPSVLRAAYRLLGFLLLTTLLRLVFDRSDLVELVVAVATETTSLSFVLAVAARRRRVQAARGQTVLLRHHLLRLCKLLLLLDIQVLWREEQLRVFINLLRLSRPAIFGHDLAGVRRQELTLALLGQAYVAFDPHVLGRRASVRRVLRRVRRVLVLVSTVEFVLVGLARGLLPDAELFGLGCLRLMSLRFKSCSTCLLMRE